MKQRGAALVLAVMAVALLSALGVSLAVLSGIETRVAANYAQALECRTAAESALEVGIDALQQIPDWDAVRSGAIMSPFADGAPNTSKLLADGSALIPTQVTTALGEPGWHLFAYSSLSEILGVAAPAIYVVVWVAPDSEGQPDRIAIRADAFAAGGTRRAVQATIARTAVLGWWNR